MKAFYNEIDRFCCDWLSNLMDAGLITPGKIDDRSIHDVRPDDVAGYERVHFFAGIGGWDYALALAGWTGPVWTGSCPCQPFSLAGAQRGFADERHLWPVWRKLVEIVRPPVVFGEQVASASEWLRLVRSELEALGYAVGALPVQAASAGADHLRDRYWIVADANYPRSQRRQLLPERTSERIARPDGVAHADELRAGSERTERSGQLSGSGSDPQACDGDVVDAAGIAEREPHDEGNALTDGGETRPVSRGAGDNFEWVVGADGKARRVKPGIRLLAHGIPNRVGLLRGFGNAIDPRPAAAFIRSAAEAMNV